MEIVSLTLLLTLLISILVVNALRLWYASLEPLIFNQTEEFQVCTILLNLSLQQ